MKKGNTKIIEIAGFRGMMTVLFVGICLVAGFVFFPAKVLMYLWNTFLFDYAGLPMINVWQGLLLWAGIALSCYIANQKRFFVSFHEPPQLNEEEMKILMQRIRLQAHVRRMNAMLMNSEEMNKFIETKNTEEVSKISDDVNNKQS